MPKEPKPNFASFTKAELVKTVKKLDARQTKLLNRIAELEHKLFVAIGNAALPPDVVQEPGPYDVVHVTQGPDTVSELVSEAKPEDWRRKGEVVSGKPAFGSIDKPYADDWQDANQGEVKSGRMFPWEKD